MLKRVLRERATIRSRLMMAMKRNSRRLQDLRATQASARKPRWEWGRYGPMRWKQQWRGTLHGRFRERLRCDGVERQPGVHDYRRFRPPKMLTVSVLFFFPELLDTSIEARMLIFQFMAPFIHDGFN